MYAPYTVPRYKEVLRLPLVPVTDETRRGLEKEKL